MFSIQLGNEKLVSPDKDLQQRFELAVKRADHLQDQVKDILVLHTRLLAVSLEFGSALLFVADTLYYMIITMITVTGRLPLEIPWIWFYICLYHNIRLTRWEKRTNVSRRQLKICGLKIHNFSKISTGPYRANHLQPKNENCRNELNPSLVNIRTEVISRMLLDLQTYESVQKY